MLGVTIAMHSRHDRFLIDLQLYNAINNMLH